jgi:hypothetical protein
MSAELTPNHINIIYKKPSRETGLDIETIKHISGHSIHVGAAQDLTYLWGQHANHHETWPMDQNRYGNALFRERDPFN